MKIISEEQKEKISQTKIETSQKSILEGIVKNDIPIQSSTKLAIPTHRTRKWITFEEYKQLIINGKSVEQLKKEYSKHLISFYTSLAKGRINLTKEQFEEEYNKGIPLNEIARSHDIPRENITYLREYYGIKRKGATYQRRLKNEVPLSQEAKDIIIGSLLGNGHITPLGYFSEKHSERQAGYLKWKASFLKPISTTKSFSYYESIDNRSGNIIKSHCFRTIAHTFLYEMREKFYKKTNGKCIKEIPYDVADLINEKVLAIWFMDDGSTDWTYRNGIKEWKNAKPIIKICTDSFSEKDIAILINVVSLKFGIKCYIGKRNRIYFDTENTGKFLDLTKKYAHSDLLYKFDESVYSGINTNGQNP